MKLQLALDDLELTQALKLSEKVYDYVDIFEIGSPFIIAEGMNAVREFKKNFPEKEILADTKIVDAGEYEAGLAFEAGADYCTVIGIIDDATVVGCLEAAKKFHKKVFVDTINIPNLSERMKQLEELGVNAVSVHVGVDQQALGKTPLSALEEISQIKKNFEISVAGGVNAENVNDYIALKPDIIISGSGICHAAEPAAMAKYLHQKIN